MESRYLSLGERLDSRKLNPVERARMLGRVLDFLFPLECVACGASGAHCCRACAAAIPLSPRFWVEKHVKAAAAFPYGHPLVRTLIGDLKFQSWTCALPPLLQLVRRWMVKVGADFCPAGTIIVPVPLHPARRRERGFNQAELLAERLAAELKFRIRTRWLIRTVRTRSQTITSDRTKNVAKAFTARLPLSARGIPILLVDDVWTTGATMNECAKALLAAGSGPVYGFALAWGSGEKEKLKESSG